MRDDQLEKEFLMDRILPLLFSSKNANIFRVARNAFEDYDTDLDELKSQYASTTKENEDFWTIVADIISDAYNAEVPVFSETEFREFIKELVAIRFDKEFRKNDVKKLDDGTDVDEYLSEIEGGNNLVLEDDESDPRVIYVGSRTSREYIEPLQPADEDYYPPLLIEIDNESKEIHLSGDKDQRNKFVKDTTEHNTINLQDEEPESYEELEIDPAFIQKLKSHDIFLKDIKIGGGSTGISLSVASGDGAIEVQDFVDYDLLLQEKQDILSLNRCEFIYVTEDEDIEFVLNFQTFRRTESNQEFIKIALELSADDEHARDEIEDILEEYGVEVYEPYYKPAAYYFNKILTTNSNYRDKYVSPLDEMDGTDLDILLENEIINPDGEDGNISLAKEVLINKIQEKLEEAERVDVEIEGRQHRIAELEEYRNNRLALVLKSYSDDVDDEHRRFYRVIIPFRAIPGKFEKIYNVVLSRINYHEIITSDTPDEVVKYLVRAAQRQIRYHQRMLVEKEARRSANILDDYYQDPEEFRESIETQTEAGYEVEDHLNVLFRYLFRDFLPGGGRNEPDGALQLQDKYYLVDSKQSTTLPQLQFSKANSDLNDSKYSNLVESDSLIFIISKRLLLLGTETGSLNPEARERVSRDEDSTFHFVSVETVSNLYDIFSENHNVLSSSHNARNEVFSTIETLIEESQHADNCEELAGIEERHLGEIRSTIHSFDYIPEDRRRHF